MTDNEQPTIEEDTLQTVVPLEDVCSSLLADKTLLMQKKAKILDTLLEADDCEDNTKRLSIMAGILGVEYDSTTNKMLNNMANIIFNTENTKMLDFIIDLNKM